MVCKRDADCKKDLPFQWYPGQTWLSNVIPKENLKKKKPQNVQGKKNFFLSHSEWKALPQSQCRRNKEGKVLHKIVSSLLLQSNPCIAFSCMSLFLSHILSEMKNLENINYSASHEEWSLLHCKRIQRNPCRERSSFPHEKGHLGLQTIKEIAQKCDRGSIIPF